MNYYINHLLVCQLIAKTLQTTSQTRHEKVDRWNRKIFIGLKTLQFMNHISKKKL